MREKRHGVLFVFDATRRLEGRFQFCLVEDEIEYRLRVAAGSGARDVVFGDVIKMNLFAVVCNEMIVNVNFNGGRVIFNENHVLIITSGLKTSTAARTILVVEIIK